MWKFVVVNLQQGGGCGVEDDYIFLWFGDFDIGCELIIMCVQIGDQCVGYCLGVVYWNWLVD